jgi:LytS/YehU family sensor histidine kinase
VIRLICAGALRVETGAAMAANAAVTTVLRSIMAPSVAHVMERKYRSRRANAAQQAVMAATQDRLHHGSGISGM